MTPTPDRATVLVHALTVSLNRKPTLRCLAAGHDPMPGTLRIRTHGSEDGGKTTEPTGDLEFTITLCRRCGRATRDGCVDVFESLGPTAEEKTAFEGLSW